MYPSTAVSSRLPNNIEQSSPCHTVGLVDYLFYFFHFFFIFFFYINLFNWRLITLHYIGFAIHQDGNDNPVCETAKETQMYRTVFWTVWEREGWDDLGEWHWNMYNIIYKTNRQPRLDAWYRMLGTGALGPVLNLSILNILECLCLSQTP